MFYTCFLVIAIQFILTAPNVCTFPRIYFSYKLSFLLNPLQTQFGGGGYIGVCLSVRLYGPTSTSFVRFPPNFVEFKIMMCELASSSTSSHIILYLSYKGCLYFQLVWTKLKVYIILLLTFDEVNIRIYCSKIYDISRGRSH